MRIILLSFLNFGFLVAQENVFNDVFSGDQERCEKYFNIGYRCVPYYNCDECNRVITDGSGLFDPRTTSKCETSEAHKQLTTSSCDKQLHVCCLLPNSTIPGPEIIDVEVGGDQRPCDEDNIDNEIFSDIGCKFIDTVPNGRKCGDRNSDGVDPDQEEPDVKEAKFGEWPHVCAVLKNVSVGLEAFQNDYVEVYLCGASLIAPGVVLTAAHCVNDTNSLQDILSVRCGEWDTQNTNEKYPYQQRRVFKIQKHPSSDAENHHNNFALLFLSSNFDTSFPHISPTCLPKPYWKPFSNQICMSHGWGKDKFGSQGKYQEILKEVKIPIVKNDKCENDLRTQTRLGEFFELDSSFICAGGIRGIDTCRGDGGAPLVCQQQPQGTWYQAGIVSWGIGCGESGVPAVYADVASASCWIDRQVSQFYGESDSYFGFDPSDCS